MKIKAYFAAWIITTISALMITATATSAEKDASAPTFQIVDYPSGPIDRVQYTTLLKLTRTGRPTLQIGHADVAQGVRLPAEGSVSLPIDDIGVMLAGRQIAEVSGQDVRLNSRQLVRMHPYVAQSAVYVEPTKLLFVFFGNMVENPAAKVHMVIAVLKGKAQIKTNTATSTLNPGDIILTPAGTERRIAYPEHTELVYIFYGENIAID